MKKILNIISYILLVIVAMYICLVVLTDNQYSNYFKSICFDYEDKFSKIEVINEIGLDKLMKSNPNTKFDLHTYYCGVCHKSVLEFDSSNNKTIFISIDNKAALEKINSQFLKNKFINTIYWVDEKSISGTYSHRTEYIVKKYIPNYNGPIGFPIYLYTNENGVVDSTSLGYSSKKQQDPQ